MDDAWHTVTLADCEQLHSLLERTHDQYESRNTAKREEELAERNGELWLGPLSAPLEDTAMNNEIEISGRK